MRSIIPKNAKLIPPQAERVFKGILYDVYHWQQEMFDGTNATFEMLKRPDTVKVIAVKDNKIVIIDQEQPDYGPFYDLPGGRHDEENETELDAAKRELLEETGLAFQSWRLLDVDQPHHKVEGFVYLFLATDFLSQTDQKLDAGEKIQVELVDFDRMKALTHDSKARYLPKELLYKARDLDGLLALPAYA